MQSSIYQHLLHPDAAEPIELGERIRTRRLALGMTQTELGEPFTKSYVSAIEHGRVLPSLQALWLIAGRLGVGIGDLVGQVNPLATERYTATRARQPAAPAQDHDDCDTPPGGFR